jgi:hypothetical protein
VTARARASLRTISVATAIVRANTSRMLRLTAQPADSVDREQLTLGCEACGAQTRLAVEHAALLDSDAVAFDAWSAAVERRLREQFVSGCEACALPDRSLWRALQSRGGHLEQIAAAVAYRLDPHALRGMEVFDMVVPDEDDPAWEDRQYYYEQFRPNAFAFAADGVFSWLERSDSTRHLSLRFRRGVYRLLPGGIRATMLEWGEWRDYDQSDLVSEAGTMFDRTTLVLQPTDAPQFVFRDYTFRAYGNADHHRFVRHAIEQGVRECLSRVDASAQRRKR